MSSASFWSPRLGRLIALSFLSVAAAAALAKQANPVHIYTLGKNQLVDQPGGIAGAYNLSQEQSPGGPVPVWAMGDGSVRMAFTGGVFSMSMDLRKHGIGGPTTALAQRLSQDFLAQWKLLPDDRSTFALGETTVWSAQGKSVTGKPGTMISPFKTVRFQRMLDGLPVYGPSSIIAIDTDATMVQGFTHSVRPVALTTLPAVQKTQVQIDAEYQLDLDTILPPGASSKLLSKRMAYYEQGLTYVQPVWVYDVQFTDPGTLQGPGLVSLNQIIVPLLKSYPEPIKQQLDWPSFRPMVPDNGNGPGGAVPPAESAQNLFDTSELYASTAAAPASNPLVGEFIVREDDSGWLVDANAFWANLSTANALTFWHPHASRNMYYWDVPWCWEAYNSIADYSAIFAAANHFSLIEGHGAPWVITCLRNNAEFIHLNTIAGYGAYKDSREKLAYVQWQSCDVIPEPGHPFEWDFTAGHTAWDVWWNIFKGMRGNFGYRTLMHIWNGVGGQYGWREGLGFQNVGAWLDSTNASVFGHSGGLDYGNCVIVSTHEGDTFYDNDPLPPPGSLTMWWCHA